MYIHAYTCIHISMHIYGVIVLRLFICMSCLRAAPDHISGATHRTKAGADGLLNRFTD